MGVSQGERGETVSQPGEGSTRKYKRKGYGICCGCPIASISSDAQERIRRRLPAGHHTFSVGPQARGRPQTNVHDDLPYMAGARPYRATERNRKLPRSGNSRASGRVVGYGGIQTGPKPIGEANVLHSMPCQRGNSKCYQVGHREVPREERHSCQNPRKIQRRPRKLTRHLARSKFSNWRNNPVLIRYSLDFYICADR